MSFLCNPYRFGAASFGAAGTVLLDRTGDQTDSATDLAWNVEVFDNGNWHDNSTNPGRVTLHDASVSLVRLVANVMITSAEPEMRKNGVGFLGRSGGKSDDSTSGCWMASAIISASLNDYFSLYGPTSFTLSCDLTPDGSWFYAEPISSTTKRALVSKTGTQSIATTDTTLTFDSESVDTDSFHDNVTNNSRLTVPSGVTLVRVMAGMQFSANPGNATANMAKNGAAGGPGLPYRRISTRLYSTIVSAPLVVTTGDYFTVAANRTNVVTMSADDGTWFQIEEVPASYKRCLVYRTSTQSISATTLTTVLFNAETYDTDSMHDTSSNTSRVVVPSGCTEARVTFAFVLNGGGSNIRAYIYKNGAAALGLPTDSTDTSPGYLNGMSGWLPVSPGDYFELVGYCQTATTIQANNTWLALECR